MKLGIIRRSYNPYGGAEQFIERLRTSLSERDIDISIFAEHWGPKAPENTRVEIIPTAGLTRSQRFSSFSKNVGNAIRKSQLDVVQTHERIPGCDVFRLGDGVHAAWLNRAKREFGLTRGLLRRLDPYHRALLAQERAIALDHHSQFVVTSELVKEDLLTHYEIAPERIVLIPNGVDTNRFTPPTAAQKSIQRAALGIPEDVQVVCFIGSDFTRKGLWPLISAIMTLKELHLIIVGKDKHTEKLKKLSESSALSGRLHYFGARENVVPFLWASDVFALPSVYDPSSNAVLEAMSCGLPIVCTEGVGNAGIVESTQCGRVCSTAPEDLASALASCLDVSQNGTMSKSARRSAEKFDQSLMVGKWLELYERVIDRKTHQ